MVTLVRVYIVKCEWSWLYGAVDDVRFLGERNLEVQMGIKKKLIWNCKMMLGSVFLEICCVLAKCLCFSALFVWCFVADWTVLLFFFSFFAPPSCLMYHSAFMVNGMISFTPDRSEKNNRFVRRYFINTSPLSLFVWVLWHINLYRLFNAKSIFFYK